MHNLFTLVMVVMSIGGIGYIAYCYVTAPRSVVVTPIVTQPGAVVIGNEVVAPAGTHAATVALSPTTPTITEAKTVERPTTIIERLATATKKSATLLVQLIMGLSLTIGSGIMNMADFFNAPEVREFINTNFTPAKASGLVVLILLITTIARVRTMFKSGD